MIKNKKVCFISLGNLYLTPYLKKYENIINLKYDIIYWNRHNIKEESNADVVHEFRKKMEEGSNNIEKLKGYIEFRSYCKNIIKNNEYCAIFLLQTNCGMLLKNILKKHYRYRYVVDIRDYTKENNILFYKIEKKLLNYAGLAVISSKGYKKFLPQYPYVLVHNDLEINCEIIREFRNKNKNKNKIVIGYIGLIRFHNQNKKLILKFKNDERFELMFIGKDADYLQKFCTENAIKNVKLIDRFDPNETLNYYKNIDIVNNLYGNNTPYLDYALSNKLYYSAKLGLPILVCSNTYMEEITIKNGFGYCFNLEDDNALDNLYKYYNNIEWEKFYNRCDEFMLEIKNDNENFRNKVVEFLRKI